MSGVELLPCAHCGGEAVLTGHGAPEFWVYCPAIGCKASTEAFGSQERAAAAWNTRTPAQGLDAATIERCAQVKETQTQRSNRDDESDEAYQYGVGYEQGCADAAAAIRALNTASTTTRGEDARLREALEAVMKRQGFAEPTLPDGSAPSDDVFVTVLCTLGDLRRARAALQGDAAHTSQEKGE